MTLGNRKRFTEQQAHYGRTYINWQKAAWPAAYPPNPESLLPTVSGDLFDQLAGDELEQSYALGYDDQAMMELGFSFKKLARGIGKAVGKVAKVAVAVTKVAAFVVPGGTALVAAAAGADKLLSAATSGNTVARNAIRATQQLAARGDKDAVNALQVLTQVHLQRKADGIKPGQSTPALAAHQALLDQHKSKLQRVVPVKPKAASDCSCANKPSEETGYFVNPQGRIQGRGRFRAA